MALSTPTRGPGSPRSVHLSGLLAETDRLAGMIAQVSPDDRARLRVHRDEAAVLATLALDGSPITEAPEAGAGWLDTLHLDEATPTAELAALEARGVRAAMHAEDLRDQVLRAPVDTLRALHTRVTQGLVAPERAGALRTLQQAVHDGSTGRIVFLAAHPRVLADGLADLDAFVRDAAGREHAALVAGLAHLEVLRLHPFDAANGRTARAFARLLLGAGGSDPDGLAGAEIALAGDAMGYHEEVARTLRRRDATIWLERWTEAVTEGLRTTARQLGLLTPPAPSDASQRFLQQHQDPTFTVVEHREATGLDAGQAKAELGDLLDAGQITPVPASRGLRYRIVSAEPTAR